MARSANSDPYLEINASAEAGEDNDPYLTLNPPRVRNPLGSDLGTMVGNVGDYPGAVTDEEMKDFASRATKTVAVPAARMGAPIAGFMLGGVPGAVLGGAIGQQIGDAIERPQDALSVGQIRRDVGAGLVGGVSAAVPLPAAVSKPVLNLARQFGAGAVTGAATAAAYDSAVDGKVDFANLLAGGAIGSMLGLVNGTQQNADTRAWLVNEIRRTTPFKDFSDTPKERWEFSNWLADRHRSWQRARNREGAVDIDAVEEPAIVKPKTAEQVPGLPENPYIGDPVVPRPAPEAPNPITQGSSVVERIVHTDEAAGSIPAPAPIITPGTSEDAVSGVEPPEPPPAQPQSVLDQEKAERIRQLQSAIGVLTERQAANGSLSQHSMNALQRMQGELSALQPPPAPIATATPAQENAELNPTPATPIEAQIDAAAAEAEIAPAATPAGFPTLLEYAKAQMPDFADRLTSESQVESFRAQWEKERAAHHQNQLAEIDQSLAAAEQNLSDVQTIAPTEPAPAAEPTADPAIVGGPAPAPESVSDKAGAGSGVAEITPTPAGPEIAPKPAEDRRVSELADRKQFKAQKGFILDAVKAAHTAAPDTGPGKVTIEVPGDGTFTIDNTKPALQRFGEIVAARFGKTFSLPIKTPAGVEVGRGKVHSPFTEPVEGSRTAPKASPVPPIGKKQSAQELTDIAKLAVSTSEFRTGLHHVMQDDGFSIGTDGNRMLIVAGGGGRSVVDITKIGNELPRWRQAIPEWVKPKNGLIAIKKGAPAPLTVDTRAAIKSIDQGESMLSEKVASVRLHRVGKTGFGVSSHGKGIGDYMSDGVTETDVPFAVVDPVFIRDALIAARMAGHEKVQLYSAGDGANMPVIIKGGDNFLAVVMQRRAKNGSPATLADMSKDIFKTEDAPKPSGIAYQPGYGPNAKPAPAAPVPTPAASVPPVGAPLPPNFYKAATPADIPEWASKPIAAQKVEQPALLETEASRAPLLARIRGKIASLEALKAKVEANEEFPTEIVQHMERRAAEMEQRLERVDNRIEEQEKREVRGNPGLTDAEITELESLRDKHDILYDANEQAQGDLKAVTTGALSDGLELIDSWIETWRKRQETVETARVKAAQAGTLGNLPEGYTPRSGGRSAASPGMPTSPPMGAPPPQMLRPVDNPDFSQFPIQLPEAVQFFRMLTNGQNPRIVERIRALHGTALGVFRYREGNLDSGRIELRADLFHLLSQEEKKALLDQAVAWAKTMKQAEPDLDFAEAVRHKFQELVKAAEAEAMKRDPARALAVFWHEIGHFIDFLPEGTLRRGNLFGHLATLHGYLKNFIGSAPDIFPVPPTSAERAALKRKAEKEIEDSVQQITETITREEPIYKISGITPKMITEIVGQTARDDFPEFYDWFAQLSRADKVDVLKKAMRGIVDERAAKFGKREQVGSKTITEEVTRTVGEISPEAIAARYRELLRAELKKRGLISLKDIKQELEGVIAWWHKRKTMPEYFKSGVEMYAETFSILMNNPAALQARAPTWWSAFQQYMIRKPQVKAMYEKVQNDIKSGVIAAQRVKNLRGSWETAEENGLLAEVQRERNAMDLVRHWVKGEPEPIWWRQLKDTLNLMLSKQHGPLQSMASKHLGKPEADRMVAALSNYLYRQTPIEGLGRQINLHVEAPLAVNNLTHTDLAEFMFHNRIVNGDALETANSQGWSPNTSTQRLEEMQRELGPMRFAALGQATRAMREIYEAIPVRVLEESRTLKPALMQKIKENVAFVPYERAPEAFNAMEATQIEGMLKAAYGEGVTAKIYHRVGSFQDIKNPYFALVKKAEMLTKFAYKQIAYKSIRDYMVRYEPQWIQQAPKTYNGHRLVPVDKHDNLVGTIYTLDDGELNGWYVPRAIYETMEQAQGLEQNLLGLALKVLGPFKAILTELNPAFWPINFARDVGGFAIHMTGGVGGLRNLPRAYRAAAATFNGKPDPLADQLLGRGMAISRADSRGEHLGHPDEMNRWLLRLNKHPELWDKEAKKIGKLLSFWEWYKSRGQVLERTVKTAGMMLVDQRYGSAPPNENIPWVTMPEWQKQEIVREISGSPNFNERGRGIAFVEVLSGKGLFANAWMRGVEQFYKAQRKDPAGVWGKFAAFIAIPALAVLLYELGITNLGDDPERAEKNRDMLHAIPERDKLRGFVIPLGWVDKQQGKVAYVVLPFPEQARMLHAAWRKTMQSMLGQTGAKAGAGSWLNYQAGDLPGMHPLWDVVGKWWTLMAKGQNPWDEFRGRPVLDDDVFKSGQGPRQLARDTVSGLSGNLIPHSITTAPGETPTKLEHFLHTPVAGTIAGRWLRVSNGGLIEADADAIRETEQERAALRLKGDEMLQKFARHEPYTDKELELLTLHPYLLEYIADRAPAQQAGALGPQVRDFMKANKEARIDLINAWTERERAKQNRLQEAKK